MGVVRLRGFQTCDNDTLRLREVRQQLQPLVELVVENAKAVRFFVQGPKAHAGWVGFGNAGNFG